MNYNEISIGDYLESQGHNPHGDRNLDGQILRGIVVEKTNSHKQIHLHTGWCVHPELKCHICNEQKNKILLHIPVGEVARKVRDSK